MSSMEATKMDGVVGEVQAGDSVGEGGRTGMKKEPMLDGDAVAQLATIDRGKVEGARHISVVVDEAHPLTKWAEAFSDGVVL